MFDDDKLTNIIHLIILIVLSAVFFHYELLAEQLMAKIVIGLFLVVFVCAAIEKITNLLNLYKLGDFVLKIPVLVVLLFFLGFILYTSIPELTKKFDIMQVIYIAPFIIIILYAIYRYFIKK